MEYSWATGFLPAIFNFENSTTAFFVVKVITAIFCVPWPVILIIGGLAIGTYIPKSTAMWKRIALRAATIAAMAYPWLFFLWIYFCETKVAPLNFEIAVGLASSPAIGSAIVAALLANYFRKNFAQRKSLPNRK